MFPLKEGQGSTGRFRSSSVVVLIHAAVLLLLTRCCEGQSQVVGPPQPIISITGEDVILPCHLEPFVDAVSMAVEWSRRDLMPRFVHVRRGGQDLLVGQNLVFKGRTSVFMDRLRLGDVSLKLSRVKLSDGGTYRCFIPGLNREAAVQLIVGSISSPVITDIYRSSDGVVFKCQSEGWYPEPEVSWLDGEDKHLSAVRTETVRRPDGLYTVSSSLTVEKRHSNSFTCRVQQKNINQSREAEIQVPAELFVVQSSPAVRISISVAVCLLSVAAVVLVVWKCGQNKKNMKHPEAESEPGERNTLFGNSRELQLLMENEGGREQPVRGHEKNKFLDMRKAKLEEELEKNEGDMTDVTEVIKTLKEQKEDLKKQREKLISLQRDDTVQIEENKQRLLTRPKTGKDDKMKKRKKTAEILQRRKNEHDEVLEKTEKLLETTDAMIVKMTERKGRLENDQEKMTKTLKEIKKLIEEIQRELQVKQLEREKVQRKLQPEQPEGDKVDQELKPEQSGEEGKH